MRATSAKVKTIFLSRQILAITLIAHVGGLSCGIKEFACSDEATCIPMKKFCDQNRDCSDGSDEPYRNGSKSYEANTTFCLRIAHENMSDPKICVLPAQLRAHEAKLCQGSTCREHEFACKEGSQCVVMNKMCDGLSYCDDGSDELPHKNGSMTYDADTTFCRERKEIENSDEYEYTHTRGWEYEYEYEEIHSLLTLCVLTEGYLPRKNEICDGSACKAGEFACSDGSQCIALHMFCDQRVDCRDGSDEPPLRNFNNSRPGCDASSCRATRHESVDVRPVCTLPPELMPLHSDICDGSSCTNDEFICLDGSGCISSKWFCNGIPNCYDGSDEPPLRSHNITYDNGTTYCKGHNGHTLCVLPAILEPQFQRLCSGTECRRNQFKCHDGSQCIDTKHFCDGYRDCRDGSDEIYRYFHTPHPSNATVCRPHHKKYICILPPYLLPYKDKICQGSLCDSYEVLCMDGSECFRGHEFCDGNEDCQDGSDEPPLRNKSITYHINTTFCRVEYNDRICVLPAIYLPYEKQMCYDSSCPEFTCANGWKCVRFEYVCNGSPECEDGSDEPGLRDFNVTYAPNVTFCRMRDRRASFTPICILTPALMPFEHLLCDSPSCMDYEFTCIDGSGCVRNDSICDGDRDCEDNSDEAPLRNLEASYDANVTFCRGRDEYGDMRDQICVFPSTVVSQTDANLCAGSSCTPDEYSCSDGSTCISKYKFCDGSRDCPDGSDEPPLYNKSINHDGGKVTLCRGHGHSYTDDYLICVLPTRLIPYQRTLCDGSSCKTGEFSCSSGSMCIPKTSFCDQLPDCLDGSDELYRNNSLTYDSNVITCRRYDGLFELARVCVLSTALYLDMHELCEGSSCASNEFSCDQGSTCIARKEFCDGYKHCWDGDDEQRPGLLEQATGEVIFCRSWRSFPETQICVLPTRLAPRKDALCDNSSCRVDEFSCADGNMCIAEDDYCNGYETCEDGSDEFTNPKQINFNGRICHRNGRQCMIPDAKICDGVSWCDNDFDERICPGKDAYHSDGSFFQCLGYPVLILPVTKLCDRVFDCPDLSDECLCETAVRPNICEKISWIPNPEKTTQVPFIECIASRNETTILLSATKVCDSRFDCQNKEDEKHCQSKDTNPDYECSSPAGRFATACDGIPECDDFLDEECRCDDSVPEFCTRIEEHFYDIIHLSYYDGVGSEPRCPEPGKFRQTILLLNEMCDGRMHCKDYADEIGCKARFYCTDKPLPNIQLEKKCDKHNDCENKADEANCSHFTCNDDGKLDYVSLDLVCDGVKDCQSASDECQPGCINSAFSDEESMITNKSILAICWIISLAALVGCSAVIVMSLWHVIKPLITRGVATSSSEHNKLMNRMVLNLAISDLFVGIYAFSICIKASQTNTDYCKIDREWRSSATCSALGAILVIGSEQSVFAMVIIAAQRLHSVMSPFSKPNPTVVTIAIAISWTASVILGVVPLIPQIEDYFVSSVGFTENRIFKVMHYQEIPYMDKWLDQLTSDQGQGSGQTDWSRMRDLIRKIDPNVTVAYEFGYYSSHTVCLPTFFPDPSMDKAWAYTFFLLLINFVCFLFMVVCYILFYRRAKKNLAMGDDTNNEENTNLQRKLTRIVISDFLCWIPICVMGFLTLNGVAIPIDVYLPAGLLIVPINSALNPLLYSDLPEIVWNKLRRIGTTQSKVTHNHTMPVEMTEMGEVP